MVTGDDGDVSGGAAGGGDGLRGSGLGAGFGRTCGVGGVGAASAATTGGRDSGTSVDGPWSVAVSGADTSSPGANALFASNGTRGSRFHNAAR